MTGQASSLPERVTVRMHNVGFGDCFLVTFAYAQPLDDGRDERHILIDFGTTSRPEGVKVADIAEQIRTRTAGEIDVVVLTHRHRDHLSAFGTEPIAALLADTRAPKLVVRPWTEDPDAAENFTGGENQPGSRSLAYARSLTDAHGFAEAIAQKVKARSSRGLSAELRQMAATQLTNADAVRQLETWAGGKGEYLSYGMKTKIEDVVPGLSVRVLGPPTIEQHPEVAGQRESDQQEFWMLYRSLAQSLTGQIFKRLATPGLSADQQESLSSHEEPLDLGPTRWIIDKLDRQGLSSLLRIVRILDDQLNNTSLILLFSVDGSGGTKRMLFGGDAQIENWEYALKHVDVEENLSLLREIDLYKVGHHGSRNATPRTLFNLWKEPGSIDHPMAAMMSTKSGVHGHHPQTAVPRETLVSALRERTGGNFFTSEELQGIWVDLTVDTASHAGFAESGTG